MIHIFDIYYISYVEIYYCWIQVCTRSFTIIEDSINVRELGDNKNKEGVNLNINSQYNIKKATQRNHPKNQPKI